MSEERLWVALLDEPPGNVTAQAQLSELDGEPAGYLAAWSRASKPTRDARRADARLLDVAGEAALCSIVLPARDALLLFDDPVVAWARRVVLAGRPADAVSTLLIDDSHFAGSITVRRGGDAEVLLRDDPFGRIAPARLLRVGPGLFGTVSAPTGPTIERHGSAQPWPWDRF